MLALRFKDVDLERGVIVLRGETTKSGKTRRVPIATARLKAVLEWLRMDVDGKEKNGDALVFADDDGKALVTFRRAWATAVLKAHGVKSRWEKGSVVPGKKGSGWKQLKAECQAAFKHIDLHWHDLRHEYASRLVERGVPLAQVRDLLGHASITTTERYDNQTWETLQAAAGRLESGKVFEKPAAPDAGTEFQDCFKIDPQEPCPGAQESESEMTVSGCEEEDLQDWLAVRDDFRTWVTANAA